MEGPSKSAHKHRRLEAQIPEQPPQLLKDEASNPQSQAQDCEEDQFSTIIENEPTHVSNKSLEAFVFGLEAVEI